MEYSETLSQRGREKSKRLIELKKEYKELIEQLATVKRLIGNNIAKSLELQGSIIELADLGYIWKENAKENARKETKKKTRKSIKKKSVKKSTK